MRVLHLATVDWDPREGVARTVTGIAGALPRHEHHLVTDRPSGEVFTGLHRVEGWAPTLPWRERTRTLVADLRPDLVHLHGGTLVTALAHAPALRDVPCVASLYHLVRMPRVPGPRLATWRESARSNVRPVRTVLSAVAGTTLVRTSLRTGRVAVLLSPDRAAVRRLGARHPERVRLATGGVTAAPGGARWSAAPTIVFAGKAERGRGVDDLLAAFPAVRAALPGSRLVLHLLPGPELGRWRDTAATLDGVEVRTGAGDLERHLAEATVAVLPFRLPLTITPPLVAVEAMAAGVPVVATPSTGAHDLVDGRTGAVVPERDPAALARAIVDVVADRTRWTARSEAARATVADAWTWRHAAIAVDAAYRAAVLGIPGTFATGSAPAVADAGAPTPPHPGGADATVRPGRAG